MSNIVFVEHLNLTQPDPALATLFHVVGLGFTRDPYLMVGLDNMWINVGATQFHLPTRPGAGQRLRGETTVVVPDPDWVRESLARIAAPLAGTAFACAADGDALRVTCPWGNRLRLVAPDPARWGATRLGIVEVAFDVPRGHADGIARFYAEVLRAPATCAGGVAEVPVEGGQRLRFVETDAPLPRYDGHHLQIYLAEPGPVHAELRRRGGLSRDEGPADFRFVTIVDPQSGAALYEVEHEVRGIGHPLYRRPLVNRNPLQRQAGYRPGEDALSL